MLSGRVGTTSALPSGTGGDDAWGLFGANDGGTAASPPDASIQTNADPRASAHPFFASARFAWGSSDDSPFDRTAVRRALLDTVPALASRCDGRGYARLRDALGTCTSASSHEHDEAASEVIAAAVEALQESTADAGILNQCILIARGIKCLDAMDVGPSEGIEAAVLLSEAATHTANPDDTKGAEGGADTAVHSCAWVGTIHRAASESAVQFRRSTKSKLHPGIKPWALMPKPAKYMGRNVYEMCNAKVNPATEVRRVKAEDCGPAVFYNECISRSNPVVIEGIGTKHGWTALRQFCDLQWLKDTHGDTCVPVEVGKRHADGVNAHRTRWMLLSEFIEEFLSTADESLDTPARLSGAKGEHVGYVSQHSLLHQCPELQTHFTVPPQCMGRLAAANAWLGTFGTVTHLHTDEADNVLCQVGGHKLVRLWPPEVGDACFHVDATRGGNGASNKFSPIDAEAPDLEKFPKFADAAGKCFVCVLSPDDSLFIPKGWWHHVRSLTPSFSLNFWF